ncbi:MAG: hypothetical protein FJ100_18865 [Deltaproteobacteria bacterium]|nr:hypothetical protein [Deltaproteobacteria bacterium]
MASRPLECDRDNLSEALRLAVGQRRSTIPMTPRAWLDSPFRPSSSILDATLSLYGNHDVVAIQEHAAPKAAIDAAIEETRAEVHCAL